MVDVDDPYLMNINYLNVIDDNQHVESFDRIEVDWMMEE
jgi:hypothetical protein